MIPCLYKFSPSPSFLYRYQGKTKMSAPEVVAEVTKPATTYEWLGSLPLAASAGNTVYSWYEGTKNCCRVSQFAIGTVESTVKYAAGTAAPLVKKLDKPSE